MSNPIPLNPLDQAVVNMRRSQAALPELCRRLLEGELFLLVPFHPELDDARMELKNGQPFPFVQLRTAEGVAVPAFSSEARVEEGLKNGKVPPRTYMAAAMPAIQALEVLGKMDLPMLLNKSCSTGELTLPANLLRDLADGTALQPMGLEKGPAEKLSLQVIPPADYPTDFLQATFDLFRRHRNFRAAWIFTRDVAGKSPTDLRPYYLLVLMDPRDERIFHDLNLVAQAAGAGHEVNLSLADETDVEYLASLFRQAKPFYQAVDFSPPGTGAAGAS